MTREPLDPHQIPDDADGGDLAAYVGEDIGRILMLRVAALTAIVCVVAGFMSESASQAVKTACLVVGGVGIVAILLAQLFRWPRRRQWVTIAVVTIASAGLLIAVFLGSR